jgi:hypothetical protein
MAMKKTTFRAIMIWKAKVQRKEWPAYESGVPGLVIHRDITPDHTSDDLAPTQGSTWAVSHAESGYRIDYCHGFARRKDAERMAQLIAPYADWTQDQDAIVRARPFGRSADWIKAAAYAIMAEFD